MLPDSNDLPAGSGESQIRVAVPITVPSNLLSPVLGIRFCLRSGVCRAAVPEAPVNEDGDLGRSKNDVCSASELWQRGPINPVAKTHLVEDSADGQLRVSIPRPLELHFAANARRAGEGGRSGGITKCPAGGRRSTGRLSAHEIMLPEHARCITACAEGPAARPHARRGRRRSRRLDSIEANSAVAQVHGVVSSLSLSAARLQARGRVGQPASRSWRTPGTS